MACSSQTAIIEVPTKRIACRCQVTAATSSVTPINHLLLTTGRDTVSAARMGSVQEPSMSSAEAALARAMM